MAWAGSRSGCGRPDGVDEDVGVDEAGTHRRLLSLETGMPGAVDDLEVLLPVGLRA